MFEFHCLTLVLFEVRVSTCGLCSDVGEVILWEWACGEKKKVSGMVEKYSFMFPVITPECGKACGI